LIVFTIKNSRSNTVYVGTTTNSIEERWTLFQLAKDAEIDAPLYKDMRHYGVACFSIEEYDYADSRAELAELFVEAMEQYDGVSLKGMKTMLPRTAVYPTSEGAVPAAKAATAKAAIKSAATAAKKKVKK